MADPSGLTGAYLFIHELYTRFIHTIISFYLENSRAILNFIHLGLEGIFYILLYLAVLLALFYLIMSFLVLFKKKRPSRDVPKGREPSVTVQIPTYNELAALNCARRALNFEYPKDKLQIIIGDDSNKRSISDKIDQFAAKYPQVLVTRRGKNIGFKPGNLNHMLKYTTGEIIVIFDSDFLPEKGFLRKLVAPFVLQKNVSVSQAKWRILNFNQNFISVLGGTISLLCHNLALSFMSWIGANTFLCGSAEAVRKRDLVAAGGWKAGALTEDIECSLRLMKMGKRLVYLEDVECGCETPYTFKDLCKQQMRWAYGVITAIKEHGRSLFFGRGIRMKDRFSVFTLANGYMFTMLLFGLTVFGLLSVLSNEPAPIQWGLFLSETARNILVTSGFLVSSIVALSIGHQVKEVPRMILSSLSVGLAVTLYVNIGIFKAVFGRPMQWFMLKKRGNEARA